MLQSIARRRCGIDRDARRRLRGHARAAPSPTIAGKASIAASTSSTTPSTARRSSPSPRATARSRRTGCASGIGNFLGNLEYPATIVNQFLQGKPKLGLRDTGRFLLNSTLGVAGLFDVATRGRTGSERRGPRPDARGVGRRLRAVREPAVLRPVVAARRTDAHRRFLLRSAHVRRTCRGKRCGASACSTSCTRAPSCCRSTRRCSGPTTRTRSSATRGCSSASSTIFDGNPPPETLEDFEDSRTSRRRPRNAASRPVGRSRSRSGFSPTPSARPSSASASVAVAFSARRRRSDLRLR